MTTRTARLAATASSASPRERPLAVRESPPLALRPTSVPATAPATPARAPYSGTACRPARAQPPTAPTARRNARDGRMRRSGANGILSPAISAAAAVVTRARAPAPAGMTLSRVRPCEAAQLSAAQADMLRIPATNPMPNEGPYSRMLTTHRPTNPNRWQSDRVGPCSPRDDAKRRVRRMQIGNVPEPAETRRCRGRRDQVSFAFRANIRIGRTKGPQQLIRIPGRRQAYWPTATRSIAVPRSAVALSRKDPRVIDCDDEVVRPLGRRVICCRSSPAMKRFTRTFPERCSRYRISLFSHSPDLCRTSENCTSTGF